MKTLQQLQIDGLFESLLSETFKDKEALDLWHVRARDCISHVLGDQSPFLDLLEVCKKDSSGEEVKADDATKLKAILERRFERAKQVLHAAKEHAPISDDKAEEDGDLKKEAEYAIHKAAARSPWLIAAVGILVAAAGFTFTGTLRLKSLSMDLEDRIQKTMDARKQALTDTASNAMLSVDRVRRIKETELTDLVAQLGQDLQASLLTVQSNQLREIIKAGSAHIALLSAGKAPDLLSVAERISDQLKEFEDRVGRAERRQSKIETNLSSLEGLSDRLDKTTISELKQLAPRERALTWATRILAFLALLVAILAFLKR